MTLTRNVRATAQAGLREVLMYRFGVDGFYTNFDGTDVVNGDQNGNRGGLSVDMPQDFPIAVPSADDVLITSETATVSFGALLGPMQRLKFPATIGTFDLDQEAALQGTNVVQQGAATFGAGLPSDLDVPTLAISQQSLAKSRQAGSTFGTKLVTGRMLLSCTASLIDADTIAMKTPQLNRYEIEADTHPYNSLGETLLGPYGTCNMVYQKYSGQYFFDYVTFRGDGIETEFFLPRSVPSDLIADDLAITLLRTIQTPTINYTLDVVTGKVVFLVAPPVGVPITVLYFYTGSC